MIMAKRFWTLMALAFVLGTAGACFDSTAPDRIPESEENEGNDKGETPRPG
jgi:hypothetical protein